MNEYHSNYLLGVNGLKQSKELIVDGRRPVTLRPSNIKTIGLCSVQLQSRKFNSTKHLLSVPAAVGFDNSSQSNSCLAPNLTCPFLNVFTLSALITEAGKRKIVKIRPMLMKLLSQKYTGRPKK